MTISVDSFCERVRKGTESLGSIYAVVGEEAFLRDEAVSALIALGESVDPSLEVSKFDSSDGADARSILDDLRARGLFGGRKLVILRDEGGGKKSYLDENKDRLTAYVQAPSKDATLVLVAPKMNKSWRLSKAVQASGLRIEADPLKPAQLERWIVKRGEQLGLALDAQVATLLLAAVGGEMGGIARELEKIDLYLLDREPDAGTKKKPLRRVEPAALAELIGFQGVSDVWQLLDEMSQGDLAAALEATEILLNRGESAFRLVAMVSWQLRQFWGGAGALAEGKSGREAAKAAKVPPFKQEAFLASLRAFDLATCRLVLEELAAVDRKDKVLDVDRAFEFFVMRLCRRIQTRSR